MFDFAVIDTDKDGKITMEEIEVYRASRVQGVDANNDGKLSVDELTAMEMKRMEEVARSKAARMVERFDADGDGQLSAAELASRPVPMRMFDRIDTDGDNAISQAEVDAARDRMAERMKDGKHHRRPAPPPMEAPDDGPEGDDN
ncbi:MAG: histidine kinase [Cereibacter sphaeroides]|uniref:Histidine kinase n=1 Tax=Cereibacter sphaeroides TaxID=1063 RepID=A0A2W5SD29_CERSP|nr:MAG: histidine kinase [Cereibacter sphaeroides]